MDIFAHALWSYIFFWKTKKPFNAVLISLAPDVFSWGIYLVYSLIFLGGINNPIISPAPYWVYSLYGITHSLIVAGVVIGLLYLIRRKFNIYILAWPIAILMDIPTHARDLLPTPFLWPVSDWRFPGFSWANGNFMIINYIVISILLVWIVFLRGKRNQFFYLLRKKARMKHLKKKKEELVMALKQLPKYSPLPRLPKS